LDERRRVPKQGQLSVRNELGIVLALPLPGQKVIISAPAAVWKLAADGGPGVVYRAAPGVFVEKLADAVKHIVLLMAQDALAISDLGVSSFSLFNGQPEVPCQTFNVGPGDIDPIVAAAISRAFIAIIQDA
jgi:hypothetical protein